MPATKTKFHVAVQYVNPVERKRSEHVSLPPRQSLSCACLAVSSDMAGRPVKDRGALSSGTKGTVTVPSGRRD